MVYTGTTEPRYDLVAAYLSSPGAAGAGAASQIGAETVLRSANFTVPNPVVGQPGGIIAIGTYLDDGIYANFVRVQDTRDPDLLGKLTVAGDITGKMSVGTSDSVAACLRAALTNTGQIIANSSACIRRAFLDGNTGQAGVADATGATKVLLDGTTGDVASFDRWDATQQVFAMTSLVNLFCTQTACKTQPGLQNYLRMAWCRG